MKLWVPASIGAFSLIAIASVVGADWDLPPVVTDQIGYRGTGMYQTQDLEKQLAAAAANVPPPSPYEPSTEGQRASEIYQNVQVLGDLSVDEFNHFMASITQWVSPEEGCGYCHDLQNMASDAIYTKVVARRMIQMNQAINVEWQPHVQETGVTCYTCHRGEPVPANAWSIDGDWQPMGGMAGYRPFGQNVASESAGQTSLGQNALQAYLVEDNPIRVHSDTALPMGDNPATTKETEATWALMMHMSESLGANCTTCHNSRAFNDWDQSPPQRVTAWHGIRMVREINNEYILGLDPVFPDNRRGPEGDLLKVGCATCHNGVQLPLGGVSMLEDYVNSLTVRTNDTVPNFADYVPGETEMFGIQPAAATAPADADGEDQSEPAEAVPSDAGDTETDVDTPTPPADAAPPNPDDAGAESDAEGQAAPSEEEDAGSASGEADQPQ